MACVKPCNSGHKEWIHKEWQCHPIEQRKYRAVYQRCQNGAVVYCKTEWLEGHCVPN